MSHLSPAVYLVWSILICLLGAFLLFHLYQFDRFKCLKWNNGPYNGAFKRVMTYSYLCTIPLIGVYTLGFVVIKYQEYFSFVIGHGIIATPYQLWTPSHKASIFPLTLIFSIGWSFEMVTHLEELCFWMFLVNAGSAGQDWFRSLYFKAWIGGSIIAVIYMPLVTILTRADPLLSEAATFLGGSLGSLSLTVWFVPILFTFPSFLKNLKREGVDMNTLVRLTKFHELNTLRVLFRFMFTAPIVVLGVDGVRHNHPINESMMWTDLLGMVAAVGCVVSSGITLVIFFPRSIEGEIAARDATKDKQLRSRGRVATGQTATFQSTTELRPSTRPQYALGVNGTGTGSGWEANEMAKNAGLAPLDEGDEDPDKDYISSTYEPPSYRAKASYAEHDPSPVRGAQVPPLPHANSRSDVKLPPPSGGKAVPTFSPNRRLTEEEGGGVEMGTIGLTEANIDRHNRMSKVNHLIHSYTSPIDLAYASAGAGQARYRGRANA